MAYNGRSFIQNVPPANKPAQTLTLYSYQGGLDNISSQQTTKNECATNVLNMVYMEDGLIQKRFGTNPYTNNVYADDVLYIDVFKTDEGEKMITSTERAIFVDGVKLIDTHGVVQGVTVNDKYMFVDGIKLYSYEKVDNAWKVYEVKSPTNLEDELAQDAKKGDKHIYVKDGSKFSVGQWIQIGERKIDNKGMVSDVPPPQTVKVLKIDGNKITLGEEITIDAYDTETTTSTNDTTDSTTNSETSSASDESTTTVDYTSGTFDSDHTVKTTIDSLRKSGTADTVTTVIGTGLTVVATKKNIKEEDDTEIKYHRLEYDYKVGTLTVIFPDSELYKYIGEWKTEGNEKWYEPCVHEIRHAYFGMNIVPPKPKHITFNKGRVIVACTGEEDNIIYMSEVNNPYYFPVSTGIALPSNGDAINGMVTFHDSVVATRSDDVYVVYGSSNNPEYGDVFTLKKITTHTGCANGNTLKVVHNYLFYLGSDGVVYRMHTTNTDVRLLATSIVSQTIDLFKHPISRTYSEMKNACATFNNEHYYLSIGDIVLIFSYRFMAWTMFDRLNAKYMYNLENEIIWSNGHKLMHFDETTFLDEGIDFNCYWESKLFDLNAPVNYKYFKYISLVFDCYEHFDSTAKLIFEIDYEEVTLNHVFKNAIFRWGVSKWGERFAKKNISKSLPIYVGRRGRLVKIKVHNGNFVKHKVATQADLINLRPDLNDVAYVHTDGTHHKYILDKEQNILEWIVLGSDEINQPIRLYNIEIEYSLRGRR